jgi:hypothetical protein
MVNGVKGGKYGGDMTARKGTACRAPTGQPVAFSGILLHLCLTLDMCASTWT